MSCKTELEALSSRVRSKRARTKGSRSYTGSDRQPPYRIVKQHPVTRLKDDDLNSVNRTMLNQRFFTKQKKPDGTLQRVLPSPLLSDERGLVELWPQITKHNGYYQTIDEIKLFEKNAREIASKFPEGTSIIDLGCGESRKIRLLLDAFEAQKKRVCYYPLDLSKESIERGVREVSGAYSYVECKGLWGMFHEGIEGLAKIPTPRLICSLGSSLGNDWFEPAVAHLQRWRGAMSPEDRLLLAMDSCKDRTTLWNSYHDPCGLFEEFIWNGLEHTNRVIGETCFRREDWDIKGVFHDEPVMHQFVITANKQVECKSAGVTLATFEKGAQIDCYEAFKYGPEEMKKQFEASGFDLLQLWESPSGRIYQYLLSPPRRAGKS